MRVFSPILLFFARHDVKWRPYISTLRSIDIMTQVCYEGTHFGARHISDPANNSSWAWHTVAAMLAIWNDPKSWAHLATLPFPKPEGFGRRPKDMREHDPGTIAMIVSENGHYYQVRIIPHPQDNHGSLEAVDSMLRATTGLPDNPTPLLPNQPPDPLTAFCRGRQAPGTEATPSTASGSGRGAAGRTPGRG